MKHFTFLNIFFLTALTACAQQTESTVKAESAETTNYTIETIVPDLNIPWGMAFLPDGSILITEKSGELIHFKDGVKKSIEGVPEVYLRGQGGLLDIKLHPNYNENGWIYISYASPDGEGEGGNTAIMREEEATVNDPATERRQTLDNRSFNKYNPS